MSRKEQLRTRIEIGTKALRHNVEQFFVLIPKRTRLMAVVKSNAYGHGLVFVAKQLANLQPPPRPRSGRTTHNPQQRLWFGVDSVVEALRLREEGIENPVLVLGATLVSRLSEAAEKNIILTISNFEMLEAVRKEKTRPTFHIKIDTGMHRQGFLPVDVPLLLKTLKQFTLEPAGIYTHFASAKDRAYPTYTFEQFKKFMNTVELFRRAGFTDCIRHASASGGALLYPGTHLDMVRIGMGLYGYWPSKEAHTSSLIPTKQKTKNKKLKNFELKPVLTWKTVVTETKEIQKGSHVGYDLTERVSRKTTIAVLPIGYWHGFDRGLSGTGEVLIGGKRRKVLGRVSMDMVVVDGTDAPRVKTGEEVVIIGHQGRDSILADEVAEKIGTSAYEVLTRINPLIERA